VSNAASLTDHGVTGVFDTGLVIVAGKGGVGKTTVTAVLARAASAAGRRVLVVELDGKRTLDELVPGIEVQHIAPAAALEEYLHDHGFKRIAKRLASTGVIDVVGTAAPGIDDLVVLGKIKQLERSGEWDVIVVDGPAAGHAITFLTSAAGLRDAVRSGPVRAQADDVLAMLGDPARCQVVLVTLPEVTPVNELIETAYAVEERVGVRLGPVVVNRVDEAREIPDPDGVTFGRARAQVDDAIAAARFARERVTAQRIELDRLAAEVALPCLVLPRRPVAGLTARDIDALAERIAGECR
jgi:arsenite/tail-anchored protein-transporting ATPase